MNTNRTYSNATAHGVLRCENRAGVARGWLLLLIAACLLVGSAAQALTTTWTGASGTDTNWSNSSNWDSGAPFTGDDAVFFDTGAVFDSSVNNYVDTSLALSTLSYTQTNPGTYQNTYIGDGNTLSVVNTLTTNAVYVGSGVDSGNANTLTTISGPNATMVVTASNGVFKIRQGGLGHFLGTASLDMSGLSNATITAKSVLIAGDGSNALDSNGGRLADRPSGTLKLAQTSTLNVLAAAAANPPGLTVGYTIGNVSQVGAYLLLGQTNYIFSDSGFAVGLLRVPGQMLFNAFLPSGYALFRDSAGTGRQSKWLIGDASLGAAVWGSPTTGAVDFSINAGLSGLVDAKVDQLVVGRSKPTTEAEGASATGSLTFDWGTVDVNTVLIGYQMQDYSPKAVGTLTVKSKDNIPAQLVVNSSMQLGRFMAADATNGMSSAILNIEGGAVTVNGNITTTTSALNPDNDSEISLSYGGSLSVKGTVGPLKQLTLGSGTTNIIDLGTSLNPLTPLCTVSNLTTTYPVYLTVKGSALDLGTIQVIKYGSYGMTDASDFEGAVQGTAFGYFTNNTVNQSIDLVITNTATFSWNGRTNGVNIGNWDVSTTPNWKSGASEVVYTTANNAQFDDSAQGTTSVNITAIIPPPTTIFKNSSKNYILTGSGAITGTGGLTKTGSGTVIIGNSGVNAFAALTLNGGTVQISGSADRLPTNAPVTLANVAGVTLDLNGQNQTIGTLAGGGTTGGEVKLGTGQLTIQALNTTAYQGLISGVGSLMVSNRTMGLGSNIFLSRDNTYSGGTVITNGAVIVTNSATGARTPLGTGPITIKGPGSNPSSTTVGLWLGYGAGTVGYVTQAYITNGQTVAFRNGLDMTFTNCVVGAGGLYVAPTGAAPNGARLTIAGTNFFTGRVQIDSGELRVTSPQPWGANSAAAALVLGNQAQLEFANNITNTRPVSHAGVSGTENASGVGIVNASGTNTMTGLITGIAGGSSWAYRSDAGKIIFRGNWTNTAVNGIRHIWLRGAGDGEWAGGIGSTPLAISGLFCTNNLIKDGAGTWTLSGTNSYNGYTGISNGTFVVNGAHLVKNASGNTNVYVASGATLRGTGQIISPPVVYILAGGTLAPGTASGMGALTISNTLTMTAATSTNVFRVSNTGIPANDQVRGLAQVNYAGTLKVILMPGTLVGGEVFKLYDAAAYSPTGFDAYDLPSIPAPLSWDTSQVTVDGTLRVNGSIGNMSVDVTSAGRALDGNFQMGGGSMLTNWNYRVLASTNAADPFNVWTQVGIGSFAGGVFSFVDLNSTNYPQRYYRVLAP